jgi:16S rRNA (adenine1518-N6/adenine1519-N6)-dimethyltransferase
MGRKTDNQSGGVKSTLRQSGLKARKGLGQHFLTDSVILGKIVIAAELAPDDVVIEVGPGLGVLTTELAKKAARVIAVEIDDKLALRLKKQLGNLANVQVVNADILSVTIKELLGEQYNYKVVANIPYYITSPILHYFIQGNPRPSLMVVMVQKEVGEAIVAGPGDMTALAVGLQLYSKPTFVTDVPGTSFYPPPRVNSSVVRFEMFREPCVDVDNIGRFLDFVRCGFDAPRKQLRNSLALGLGVEPSEVTLLLAQAGIEAQRRPEALSIKEWERLYTTAVARSKG